MGAGLKKIIEIKNLNKTYDGGFQALKNINLDIHAGEIFALLGPNGAGKTTLISTICGLSNITSGSVRVDGHDVVTDFRHTRDKIGLVPQELTLDAFEKVIDTTAFTRGLFGKPKDPALIEKILKQLSLWDKRDNQTRTLSGGMRRRLLIAKALSHNPSVLFLDEPTAGVDVELRKDMWQVVRELRDTGVTIILTTHYIEEAEEMADRVGVIQNGELIHLEKTEDLMAKMGSKELSVELIDPLPSLPNELSNFNVTLKGGKVILNYDSRMKDNGVDDFFAKLNSLGINFKDVSTKQSSLEDIFLSMVSK